MAEIRNRRAVNIGEYPLIGGYPPGIAAIIISISIILIVVCIFTWTLYPAIPIIPLVMFFNRKNKEYDKGFMYVPKKISYKNYRTDLFIAKIENSNEKKH